MDNYIPYYKRDLQGLNKSECVDVGYAEVRKFCEVNHITPPQLVKKDTRGNGCCGLYYWGSNRITVYAPSVANISPHPAPGNRQWSYPGYRVDRTGVGVTCHETGHYLDNVLRIGKRRGFPYKTERVSSYEPFLGEAIAETLRIFILNPCLLHIYAPERCEFLINEVGLKPHIEADWDEVLANAPNRYTGVLKRFLQK